MADALLLAKHVAANDKSDPTWDTNADGRVDQTDVDALAAAAVSLKQPALARRLPEFKDIGLDRLRRARFTRTSLPLPSFAKANPTENGTEAHP